MNRGRSIPRVPRVLKTSRGFTLVEVVFTTLIMTIIMAGVFEAVITVMKNDARTSAKSELHTEAVKTMNRIEGGGNSRFGLMKARIASVVLGNNGQSITFSVDQNATYTTAVGDDTTQQIYVSDVDGDPATVTDDLIMLDPDTATPNNQIQLGEGVSNVSFTVTGSVVTAAFTIQRLVRGTTYKSDITQDIYLRN